MASSLFTGLTRRLARRRSELPSWLTAAAENALEHPGSLLGRAAYRVLGADTGEATANPQLDRATRVYLGPLNYAGQAHLWARALRENLPNVDAVNAAVVAPRTSLNFACDIAVPLRVYRGSDSWRAEQEDYLRTFTHAIAESGRSLFGERVASDPFDELARLHSNGVETAVLLHGTDIRLPSRHRAANPNSPFADADRFAGAERQVQRLLHRLDAFDGPVFVSTPDLLVDVPRAVWCPVVVDPSTWATDTRPFTRATPRVIHVPSRSSVKGTELVEPAVRALEAEGLISYRRIEGAAPATLPGLVGDADIVLDQFAIGSYGVAACEAMAAGRVVVGDVSESVRDAVTRLSGADLPIVQSRAQEIGNVLRRIIAERETFAAEARRGVEFVGELHSGPASATRLAQALGIPA
jgi:hypothetical protein